MLSYFFFLRLCHQKHLHSDTYYNIHSGRISKVFICWQSQRGLTCLGLFCSQTRPTIAGLPWQVSQGSSSVIAASSFITGIIRCTFNKPWSQIGILSYAPMNNGWTGEECLGLLGSQMSNKSLETINVCGPKRQHWHITQGQKFTVVAPGAKLLQLRQRRRQSCSVSTDPITIWIMGFSFLFWQGLSISHPCACSPTDAPSVTNTELLSASSSSPFQANKFIHLVLCYSVQHHRLGTWTGDPCEGFSPRTQPGDTLEGKAEAGSELDLLLF